MARSPKIYIQRKTKKLKFRFSFLWQLYHMLEKLYMIPHGKERGVLIFTYHGLAANSNICHPLNVHLGKHQVQGAHVPLPSPCLNRLYKHGVWEGQRELPEELCLYSREDFRCFSHQRDFLRICKHRHGESPLTSLLIGFRIDSFADNIAVQGEFATTFHNSRAAGRGHTIATYLDPSQVVVVRERRT